MNLDVALGKLPRVVLIEAIYLAGQHLTHQRSSVGAGSSENAALTADEASLAREVAASLLATIHAKEDDAIRLSMVDRHRAMDALHQYLRNSVNHDYKVTRQADAELEKIREETFAG